MAEGASPFTNAGPAARKLLLKEDQSWLQKELSAQKVWAVVADACDQARIQDQLEEIPSDLFVSAERDALRRELEIYSNSIKKKELARGRKVLADLYRTSLRASRPREARVAGLYIIAVTQRWPQGSELDWLKSCPEFTRLLQEIGGDATTRWIPSVYGSLDNKAEKDRLRVWLPLGWPWGNGLNLTSHGVSTALQMSVAVALAYSLGYGSVLDLFHQRQILQELSNERPMRELQTPSVPREGVDAGSLSSLRLRSVVGGLRVSSVPLTTREAVISPSPNVATVAAQTRWREPTATRIDMPSPPVVSGGQDASISRQSAHRFATRLQRITQPSAMRPVVVRGFGGL